MLGLRWFGILWYFFFFKYPLTSFYDRHIYDYYFDQGGSFFGTKKGCEPLHIQFEYQTRTVYIVNSLYEEFEDLQAIAEIYHINGTLLSKKSADFEKISEDQVLECFQFANFQTIENISDTFFVRLLLQNSKDQQIFSKNTYWLSLQEDVLEWNNSNFYRTPCSQYANFTSLAQLPKVQLKSSFQVHSLSEKETKVTIVIENPSSGIAFFVKAKLLDENGNGILPIYWTDNYVTLVPNEKQQLEAVFETSSRNQKPKLILEVYNNFGF